jgi:hypothetical protein
MTCKQLVEEAKIMYENGSVGCNYFYKGFEMSCCQGAGTDAENTVVAQEVEVENPCLICPNGATEGLEDYAPYEDWEDPITCKELIDDAKLFEKDSLWCSEYEGAGTYCCPTTPDNPCTLCPNGITVADNYEPYNDGNTCAVWVDFYAANFDAESDTCTVGRGAIFESHCCPTVANNPCTICPDGATAGEEFVPYSNDNRTCEDIINAALTFDAESEMCLVHAKYHEFKCCSSSTTSFDDYCNICTDGITAGDSFVQQWSGGNTCKNLVEEAKIIYENGSVGCNYYKGYELRCCGGTGTDAENTPPSFAPTPSSTPIPDISPPIGKSNTPTTTPITPPSTRIPVISPPISPTLPSSAPTPSPTRIDPLYIVEITTGIVGAVAALVGAAFAFAKWKQKMNSPTSTPAMPTTVP